jgi:hypothetical protein
MLWMLSSGESGAPSSLPCRGLIPLVQDFAETLPVGLAQPFAILLVHLRAARVDQP